MSTDHNNGETLFAGKYIVAGIDGSSVSDAACDYACWVASSTQRPLKLLHSIEHNPIAAVSDYSGAIGLGSQESLLNELTAAEQARASEEIKIGQQMLNTAKARAQAAQVAQIETYQHRGEFSESLVALEDEIRLVVIGIRGQEHEQTQEGIGHHLQEVIQSIHRPVMVVNKAFTKPRHAMLAYDGSATCKKALTMVASSKLFEEMSCHIVHVGTDGEQLLAEAKNQLEQAGITAITAQIEGEADIALSNYQIEQDIDLTIMGAFSHSKFRHWVLGSFTAKMLAATQRPLLLLR